MYKLVLLMAVNLKSAFLLLSRCLFGISGESMALVAEGPSTLTKALGTTLRFLSSNFHLIFNFTSMAVSAALLLGVYYRPKMAAIHGLSESISKIELQISILSESLRSQKSTEENHTSDNKASILKMSLNVEVMKKELSRLQSAVAAPTYGEQAALIPPAGTARTEPARHIVASQEKPKLTVRFKQEPLQISLSSEDLDSISAKKPSFDVTSEVGRERLKLWLYLNRRDAGAKKQNAELESPRIQEEVTSPLPVPTYNEIPQTDPATKKRFKRIHIPNRGWISVKKFEEERARFGGNSPVKMGADAFGET